MKWVTLIGYPCIRYSDKNRKYFFFKLHFTLNLRLTYHFVKYLLHLIFKKESRMIFSKETANAHLLEAGLG